MIDHLAAFAVATVILTIGQLWVLDKLFSTYHETVPAGLSTADGSQDRYWERWCYWMMSEEVMLSVTIGLLIGLSSAFYRTESALPLFAALATATAALAALTVCFRPNRKDVSLWNRRNQVHVLLSMLLAAAVAAILLIGLGGTVPLLIGCGAAAFALFVSFVSGV